MEDIIGNTMKAGFPRLASDLVARGEDALETDYPERGLKEWYPAAKLGAKSIGFHVAEVGPGQRSGTHRHNCEALIYVLEGHGTSELEGERISWKKGDTYYVPPMWWHYHESDAGVTSRLLGMWNIPLLELLGLFYNEEAGVGKEHGVGGVARRTVLPE